MTTMKKLEQELAEEPNDDMSDMFTSLYDNIYPKCKIADDILNQKEKYTHRHK
jgi:hypothetical protein